MTTCTCHPGNDCASAASCAAARRVEFGDDMTTTQPAALPEPLGWYFVNNIGMATLCKDKAEAQLLAEECDMVYKRQAPHRAVQLVALQSQPAAAAVSDGEIVKLAFEMCSACYSGMDHQFAGMSVVKFARAILALRPAAQTEREAFEEWYAEDANKQTGKPGWFTPKSIAELRDGDGYGEHRVMLNGKWEGWQARASLPAPQQAKHDQFADASKMVPPVALRSVHLTRDTAGMCVVRINGRVAIRDNGDIIDHMATLEWFADTQQATPEPAAWLVSLPDEPELGEWFSEEDMSEKGYTSKPLFTRPAPGVPEGFALVPVEPTPAMKTAGINVEVFASDPNAGPLNWEEVEAVYRAMLAADQAKGGE